MRKKYDNGNFGHYRNSLIVIMLSIIFYKFTENMDNLYDGFLMKIITVIGVMKPFLMGVIIAYILNPIVNWVEVWVLERLMRNKKRNKYNRMISTVAVFILFIAIIVLTSFHILPRLLISIGDLITGLPSFISENQNKVIDWINNLYSNDVYNIAGTIENWLNDFFSTFSKLFQVALNNLLTSIISLTSGILNTVIALVVSFYILVDRTSLLKGTDRLLRALFEDKLVDNFKKLVKEADAIFVKYVIGKSLDSFIIGLICFIGLKFMDSPYMLLISIVVGITNMLPYVGPFFGEVFAFIIISFHSTSMALWVLLFLFILQQFDSFILTPKILGDTMGLSPLWIIFAIALGGSLYGVLGMFLGVPAVSIVIVAVTRFIDRRLEERKE